MKVGKIKKLCLAKGRFDIVNTPFGEQWIGNGFSYWPVEGVKLTEEGVGPLFDLTLKQMDSVLITERTTEDDRFRQWETPPGETLCEKLGEMCGEDETFIALETRAGVCFIPESALWPMPLRDNAVRFYARRSGKDLFIAVYADLECAGLIAPIIEDGAKAFQEMARRIAGAPLLRRSVAEEECGRDAAAE